MRNPSVYVACIVVGISVLPARSDASGADPDATIRVGSMYEPLNLDNTAGAGQGITEAFNGNVYEGLFRLDDNGAVVPVLAAGTRVSDDGLTYTFQIRQGVRFHSGAPLTSLDVKTSIEHVMAPGSKSSRKASLSPIRAIEAPDAQTVVLKLAERSVSLPYNLSYVWIVSHAAGDVTAKEDGTGPYRLSEWRRGSALQLVPFDGYWGTKPANGGVYFQYFTDATAMNDALLTDAVDIVTSVQSPDSIAQFKNNPSFTVSDGTSTTKEILAYNDRVAPFDKVDVRKALARAVDKKRLLNSVWGDYGLVIGSFVPPTDPWYVDLSGVDAYDPASAKDLLAKSGYPNGFAFTLDTPDYDPHPIVAQFLQAELAKVGVQVKINIITANEWYTKIYQNHDFQATLQEHVNHRDIVFYGNPNFYWGYDNPKVVDLIAASEKAASESEQAADLKEADKVIVADAASNWLYLYPKITIAAKSISGYPLSGLNAQFPAAAIRKSD